jgi:hypothetical protein
MSELVKVTTQQLDGFDTFEDAVEGEEERATGLIQGDRIKFTNQAEWVLANNDTALPQDLELLVWDVLRVVQKWPVEPGAPPIEERVLQPGEKIPDIAKLNTETPQSEWRPGPNGQMQGPWQFQFVVYLFHEETAAQYTWASGTTGAKICLRDLAKRTHFIREYRGAKIHAVVTLTDTFMPTQYGGRQRPAFNYKRWIKVGGDEPVALPAAEAPTAITQTLDQFANAAEQSAKPVEAQPPSKAQTAKPAAPKPTGKAQTVTVPTAKEATNDGVPY